LIYEYINKKQATSYNDRRTVSEPRIVTTRKTTNFSRCRQNQKTNTDLLFFVYLYLFSRLRRLTGEFIFTCSTLNNGGFFTSEMLLCIFLKQTSFWGWRRLYGV
jgi:hypothetical protein